MSYRNVIWALKVTTLSSWVSSGKSERGEETLQIRRAESTPVRLDFWETPGFLPHAPHVKRLRPSPGTWPETIYWNLNRHLLTLIWVQASWSEGGRTECIACLQLVWVRLRHQWNFNACCLKWSPLFVFRASLGAYLFLSALFLVPSDALPNWPPTPNGLKRSCCVQLRFLLCPHFHWKEIFLLSIHHLCGSQEHREDMTTLLAVYSPAESQFHSPELLLIPQDMSPAKASFLFSAATAPLLTCRSVRIGKCHPFQGIHNRRLLECPSCTNLNHTWKQDVTKRDRKFQGPHLLAVCTNSSLQYFHILIIISSKKSEWAQTTQKQYYY